MAIVFYSDRDNFGRKAEVRARLLCIIRERTHECLDIDHTNAWNVDAGRSAYRRDPAHTPGAKNKLERNAVTATLIPEPPQRASFLPRSERYLSVGNGYQHARIQHW